MRERERERKKIKRLTIGCLEIEGWRRGRGRDEVRYIGKEEREERREGNHRGMDERQKTSFRRR